MESIAVPEWGLLLVMVLVAFLVGINIYIGRKTQWYRNLINTPIKYNQALENNELMDELIEGLEKITTEERVILLERIFRQPINVFLTSDSGKTSFCGVALRDGSGYLEDKEQMEKLKQGGIYG